MFSFYPSQNKFQVSGYIYCFIFSSANAFSLDCFEMLLLGKELSFNHICIKQYCRQQNPKQMEQLFYQEDNFQEEATCKVTDSFKQEVTDIELLDFCILNVE